MSGEELKEALNEVRRLEAELDAAKKHRDGLIAQHSVVVETASDVAPLASYVLITPRRRHAWNRDRGALCGRQRLPSDEPLPIPTVTLPDLVTCEDCLREMRQ